jgi:Leucine-rich repeat (LRR) protein
MKYPALRAAIAVVLFLGATAAYAQQKTVDDKGGAAPQRQHSDQSAPKGQVQPQQERAEPKDKTGKGTARTEPKDKGRKDSAQTEPKGKVTKETGQSPSKERAREGSAQTQPKEETPEANAEGHRKDKSAKDAGEGSRKDTSTAPRSSESTKGTIVRDSTIGAPASNQNMSAASSKRLQISEQQRTTIHKTILEDRSVNRVTRVNIIINVGTRIPRNIRLALLPASVISIVPEYRSYRYFVLDDQICIVEPSTFEIVELITVSENSAARTGHPDTGRLVLTDEERAILLREIDMAGDSTLGLGTLAEGADVPRDVNVRVFPETIVQKIPNLKDYKFFTAENRIAIVDLRGSKVETLIEGRR